MTFDDIPQVVIDYVRQVFATANDKVSRRMSQHPSMHEESLDHSLIDELTDAPPAFFADARAAVVIESHWLGGRRMWGRWEIADIALIVMLRSHGRLDQRKVALLQTKRLYSDEIAVEPLGWDDFAIGIGRLADRTDPIIPLTRQRTFSFDNDSKYGAMSAGSKQVGHIEAYVQSRAIPVFYALYNPLQIPFQAQYPTLNGQKLATRNDLGCRVQTMDQVHGQLAPLTVGQPPTFGDLKHTTLVSPHDAFASSGWRLENFVADEVLRCRQGALFDVAANANLRALFYERTAPIEAAITITIDIDAEG